MGVAPYSNVIRGGYNFIKDNQKITFKTYRRVVLPLDKFIYWVKLSDEVLMNCMVHKTEEFNHEVDNFRNEATIILITEDAIFDYSNDGIDEIKVFKYNNSLYLLRKTGENAEQSGVYHHIAHIIEPQMQYIFLDSEDDIKKEKFQLTSSIPLFISFSSGLFDLTPFEYEIYPAWLTPYNKKPPYIAIEVEETTGLDSGFQNIKINNKDYLCRLVQEKVKLVLYGFNHDEALIFLKRLEKWSQLYNYIGFMSSPCVTDEIYSKTELGSVASKKTIDLEISYVQTTALLEELRDKLISMVLMKFNYNNEVKNVLRCKRE